MLKLSKEFLNEKVTQIRQYGESKNGADGSKFDANANVEKANTATRSNELLKDIYIQINRHMLEERITTMFGEETAQSYTKDLESHLLYTHDETSLFPYCTSINMYPFLTDGLTKLGGESEAPNNLQSFCGSFINLVFAVSSQFAGAVATVEFLMYFEHFVKKEYGSDWYKNLDKIVSLGREYRTLKEVLEQYLQGVVYTINQPAAARGYQSVFWNISIFDEHYFKSLFGDFCFPDEDMTAPEWEGIDAIQRLFLTWFNKEREKKVLTFPVVTAALLTKDGHCKDESTTRFLADEMASGNSFFVYMSDSADSLASCCRLRNEVNDTSFSYSLGAGGVATGSVNVMTLNINRFIQTEGRSIENLEKVIDRVHKYQIAYRSLIEDDLKNGMLTVYDAGFISLDKQFCTIGINGFVEAAEFLNIAITPNQDYFDFCRDILGTIYKRNRKVTAETGVKFNTEFVPAENLGVKNAKWDRDDGLFVPRDVYNSYFYIVESETTNPLDKFTLHGKDVIKYLDGGSALHLNLDVPLSAEKYYGLFQVAATSGSNYWTVNVKNTICNDCGHIEKRPYAYCVKCESSNVDGATRVIGYIKRISSFSKARQQEAKIRHYEGNK
ncbi:MAG: hypothetical protein [Caudoviricetes sp.]|nr:MAG: hypothetical protein [Caudoviricetes sp.]